MHEKSVTVRRTWWQTPSLHTEEDQSLHRKVSWLELFYDLVFVAVIAQLSHNLALHMSWSGFAGYALLFVPVWWLWISGTFYNERFETFGLETRIFTFIQMLPVAAMAVFAHGALGSTGAQFALAYATGRVFYIFLWARAGYYVPESRPTIKRYVVGFSISVLLFVISATVQPPFRYVLWIIGLTFDIATPIITMEHQKKLPKFSSSKLPERFGLLVILVLGEVVIGTVNGLAEQHHLTWTISLVATIGMLLAFSLWWIYFDFVARRAAKPSVWWSLLWAYGHLPLVMGLVSVGSAVLVLVGEYDNVGTAKQLLPLAIGVTLGITGLLELTLRRSDNEPTHPWISPLMKIIAGSIAASLVLWSASMTIAMLLLILLLLLLSQIGYGVYVWFSQDLPMDDSLD